jgi:hypothetical protein
MKRAASAIRIIHQVALRRSLSLRISWAAVGRLPPVLSMSSMSWGIR